MNNETRETLMFYVSLCFNSFKNNKTYQKQKKKKKNEK